MIFFSYIFILDSTSKLNSVSLTLFLVSLLLMSSSYAQVQDAEDAPDLQLTAGQVEFDRVCFSYVPGCVGNN